jgi:cytochrome b561/HPt (histidine-containing phosphotransfer) domain-containing protein
MTPLESKGKYPPLLQIIHWTVALLVICQLAMGCLLGQLRSLQYGQSVMGLHRQLGFLVLIISLVRLVAVLRQRTPALGGVLPDWQTFAARCVHAGFYTALIAEPIFGLFVAWARGDAVTAFGLLSLPEPWDISDSLRDHCMTAHIVTAAALLGLVTVHVGAVLFNHWRRRVPVLERMLPSGPDGTLVNRVPVAAQLLSALGIVVVIALAFGINAVVKYRELTASRLSYQATDQVAADESRSAQVAWKEIVGIESSGISSQGTDRLRALAETALGHLDSGAQALADPTARSAITGVAALVRPLSEGKESFSAAAITAVDTQLQDLVDTQAANAQQRLGEITEGASLGHDLIVVTLAPMVLLGLVLAILLARSMSTSISRMRALVRGVASNEKSADIIVRGRGELAELMRDMVSMQTAVQQRTQREADERLAVEQTLREGLEVRVLERTAELSQKTADVNAMLNNMNLGVSTVVRGNRIHPEYSNYLHTIFSIDDFADQNVVDCLFAKSSLGVDAKDQIAVALGAILGEEEMMFEFNSHLLAREMDLEADDGTRKIVQMAWSPIIGDHSTVDKVLLITQDVTQLRDLEKSSALQKDELDAISKIIKISIGKFNDFFESTKGFIAANRRLIDETVEANPEVIAAMFRNMHTIKGNARMFEFTLLTNAAHNAEQTYDRLRKDAAAPWAAAELRVELDAVAAAAAYYVKISEETLGRKGRASDLFTTRGVFVGNEELAELRSLAAAPEAHPGAVNVRLRRTIGRLGLIPLPRIIAGSIDSLSSVCTSLGKPTPAVEMVNADIAFISQFAEAFKSSLIHLLRNSLDHGIEAPADRILAGKPPQGTVTFACERDGDRVELRIGDDGRGLALHGLYEKGLASGSYSAADPPTRDALANSIFRSGLSTAAQVTDISGRGVGLDAVRVFLKEQGATIRVALDEPGDAPLGFSPFAFVISVPLSALRHAEPAETSQLVRDVLAETTLSDPLPNVA